VREIASVDVELVRAQVKDAFEEMKLIFGAP